MGDTWQIGTTSIREDHKIASGLRFIHWCHASPNVQAKQNPKNYPTVRVYQHIEDQLTKAGSDTDDILALTTTREGATNLRNYFSIAGKKANAETAVKVAGATAKHCIVIHGLSTFLSGEGGHQDYDQECFTRANVAYSRATDLTILACPLNMQGMPGALSTAHTLPGQPLHSSATLNSSSVCLRLPISQPQFAPGGSRAGCLGWWLHILDLPTVLPGGPGPLWRDLCRWTVTDRQKEMWL